MLNEQTFLHRYINIEIVTDGVMSSLLAGASISFLSAAESNIVIRKQTYALPSAKHIIQY